MSKMAKRKAWDSTNASIPDAKIDQFPRFPSGYSDPMQEDNSDNFAGLDGSREFPDALWIDPSDWKDAARDCDNAGTWAEATRKKNGRYTNQGGGSGIRGTHECTCHSLSQGAEAAYRVQLGNAVRNGIKPNICVSQISIYAEANPRQWGGANCLTVLRIAMERGFLPEPVWGQDDVFRHTLHGTCGVGNDDNSRGSWVPLSRFPSGWKDTAKELRPLEAINPRTVEQAVCLLLAGYVVNVGRSGHAVPWNHLVWRGNDMLFGYSDSYDRVLYDSARTARGAISGASSITLMTSCQTFEDHFYGDNDQ